MTARRPRPAMQTPMLPALATLLAGGAALAACESPRCQPDRLGEVGAHRDEVGRRVARMELADALAEIGVATGLLPHRSTRITGGGAVPAVTTVPPVTPPVPPPVPQVVTGGVPVAVTPEPAVTAPPRATHARRHRAR